MSKTVRLAPDEAAPSAVLEKARARVGQTLDDRYAIEAVITANESGAIYRASHIHLRTRVVLKVLDAGAPPSEVARLEREAIAGSHIAHPNVASSTDTGALADGARFVVMEHIAGATLRQVLDKGPMPVARAVRVAVQVASGLAAAHEHGIVHRNVEPRNVMLTGESGSEAKIIDFGRAKVDPSKIGEATSSAGAPEDLTNPTIVLTTFGILEGTTAYLPLEASLGSSVLDEKSDLYSLGVVFYEMLAGKRPFDFDTPAELFAAQRDGRPPSIAERAPTVVVPPAIDALVMKLLERDRDARPPSAAAFRDELAAAEKALEAAENEASAQRAGPTRKMRAASGALIPPKWKLPLAIAAVSVVLGVVVTLAVKASSSNEPKSASAEDDEPVSNKKKRATPSASDSASAEPPPPPPTDVDGLDAIKWRAELIRAAKDENWIRANQGIHALVTLDPDAFKEPAVVGAVASTAVAIESGGGQNADNLFDALTNDLGEQGWWLLFEIVRTKGATKGSERAALILQHPDLVPHEPPALRIAFELVTAKCEDKPALFPRAVTDGDQRALTAMRLLKEMDCPRRRQGPCCFKENKELAAAIKELEAKLKPPAAQ